MYTKRLSFKKILSVVISLFLMIGFILSGTAKAYRNISPSDLKDLINASTPMIIVDVRTPQEHSTGRIPTSVNIPLDVLKTEIANKNVPKSTNIIVYCQSGNRSSKAAKLLDDLGYTNVYNLGGIKNWPYQIVK
ncbi:rhodanese-like domain-containing protein [Clostridium ganghwense]|uniref:Rhodanese-like domain-containing protein n=1 Tax=Clostridium ganghwense TaxID=312089 RepID=A0ABT4CKJ3_9CLOT|nr:rhodanese-like domain-containing protein [Clostridium ganghwense]MCY6369564.1 rhodanese-like domain-containing protein [Clostridium ganghwense]